MMVCYLHRFHSTSTKRRGAIVLFVRVHLNFTRRIRKAALEYQVIGLNIKYSN